ncbi:transposase, partial [Orrella sp. 11846]|uniref:transposase n=1 Tax=Orrella sp. 11846 TaxID=3409913 RepID=UPI003B5B63C7
SVFGDSGYIGAEKRPELEDVDVEWHIAMKPSQRQAIKDEEARELTGAVERTKASIRAKVEHAFRILKCQFGFRKVRYRGLLKNTAQVVTLLALGNIWMAR